MPYTHYTDSKPAITDSGQDVVDDTRENLEALRDAVIAGRIPKWNMTVTNGSGGTALEPKNLEWRKGSSGNLALRATITWGTSGGSNGNPTTIVYHATGNRSNASPTWDSIGTLTMTYDTSGNARTGVWS